MATRVEDVTPFAANDLAVESREWFTAAELAELALPGMPADKRSINRKRQQERWSMRQGPDGSPLIRPRAGRGGGVEFHVSLLPGAARLELARRGITQAQPIVEPVEDAGAGAWRWYDAQKASVKAKAEKRLAIVNEVLLLEEATGNRTAAIAECARRHGVATSTLWNWLGLIDGVAHADRLPALASRHSGGGKEAEIDPDLWHLFKSDALRNSASSLSVSYKRLRPIAAERGLSLPSEASFRRRLKREVDPRVLKLAREGEEAVRRSVPAERRTVEHLRALEMVNVDGHKFDVRVEPPGGGDPIRPIMVAIQDVRSSKLLAWRLDLSENAVQTRLAFADLFRNYGIPRAVVLDNGRAFASKWITGGAKSRFRFKIKPEEPTGVLTGLGIEVKWALPYRGQSKPIERAFRDLCDLIARHARAEGAYTGSNPTKKPANYGKRAMTWEEFESHVERQIAFHNAQLGRTGRDYRGRSFDQVFAETWAEGFIGKTTEERLRLALLAAEQVRVNRQTHEIALFGNRYWSPACGTLGGERVTVRFDPDNLNSEVYLYDSEGRFLTAATIIDDRGFDDIAGAKASAKRVADYKKMVRAGLDAEQLLSAEDVAAAQDAAFDRERGANPERLPEPTVVRAVRHSGSAAQAVRHQPQQPGTAPIDRMQAAVLRLVEKDQ